MKTLRTALVTSVLSALVIAPGAAISDDTEIFFGSSASNDKPLPNVLFMVDNSGSMDRTDGGTQTRMQHIKKAMLDLVVSTDNVNVGVGAFNGQFKGGSIHYPVTQLNADACPNASCVSITVYARIEDESDDADESSNGTVSLSAPYFDFTEITGSVYSTQVGLRFSALKVPRGATITSASVEFTSSAINSDTANLTITGENIANTVTFSNAATDISGRADTLATANWSVGSWDASDTKEQSVDISNIVQEITARSDWCGGNALSLFFDGEGIRPAKTREDGYYTAPVLSVTYNPASVDFLDTCVSQTVTSSIDGSNDDANEVVSTGDLRTGGGTLSINHGTDEDLVGWRFNKINVPAGAIISNAYIELTSAGFTSGPVGAEIRTDISPNPKSFSKLNINGLSGRSKSTASVDWPNIDEVDTGLTLHTPNLAPLISDTIASSSWVEGNAIVLLLAHKSGTGTRDFQAFDSNSTTAARLVIDYQVDESILGGVPTVLKTAREELIDTIHTLYPHKGTPLVDAYYEGARYMLGQGVDFGTKRGEQNTDDRFYRVSIENSYTGGSLYSPPGCLESDYSSVACITEEISGAATYQSPMNSSCQSNQIVLLSDGEVTRMNSVDRIKAMTGNADCAVRGNTNELCGLELSTWLYDNDHAAGLSGTQNIITHTVGFNFSSDFLTLTAANGGGQFFEASSASALTSAFNSIVRASADVSTSFVAPSATVSQFNRLTNRDDLYFAMFKPNTETKWDGNLKKYKLANVSTTAGSTDIQIVDTNSAPIFDSAIGQVKSTATSFWSTSADGAEVAQGGAASQIPVSRTIKTFFYNSGVAGSLVDFHETNADITKQRLGINGESAGYRDQLLQWARGVDIKDYDNDTDITEVRAQLGDPMHTTPTIINYANKSVVFMGTNEGFLHAIDTDTGAETFAFIPPELLLNLNAFYDNASVTSRPYGLDGGITSWIEDANDNLMVDAGEQAYVVVGMRRGGQNYYALNVTNPASPTLAWVIQGGSGDFTELGQSWSKPVKTRVNVSGTPTDVLIFAAGYDSINDSKTERDTADLVGRGIYIVNAKTGARIAGLTSTDYTDFKYSIPSSIRAIDINVDGLADRMYVGDMGGQLWRFDIDNQSTSGLSNAITGGVIAELGSVGTLSNRRFFNEPDVALHVDENNTQFLTVALGSGWRSHPLDTVVEDRFYVIRDYAVYSAPRNTLGDVSYTKLDESDLFDATTSSARDDNSGAAQKGWFISLSAGGEKSLSSASTLNGQIVFTTYLPDVSNISSCSAAVGGGRVYAIDAIYGDPVVDLDTSTAATELELSDRFTQLDSPGIPPKGTALIPTDGGGTPTLIVGLEQPITDLDFGELSRKTFWYEN